MSTQPQPRLYSELAAWFHILTAPEEYAEEAAEYRNALLQACELPPKTLLELGSGGGNNAWHLKREFTLTLTDISPEMLRISQSINPECEHIVGDMRTLRLNRVFDAILIHDAICYMATPEDLRQALVTAFVHCRPGGAALFAPDYVRETFQPHTNHGGNDLPDSGRAMRYLEWIWDPDPSDNSYLVDYAYLLRDANGNIHTEHDRHYEGLFAHGHWLEMIESVGFEARAIPFQHSEVDHDAIIFLGVKRLHP